MKFGLFYQMPCAPDQTEPRRYQDTIEQIVHGDALGFDIAWLAEHHFYRPFSIMAAPLIVATAIAQRTRRIRLGTGVVLLPLHNPLLVAAEAATVDILSGGRLELGIGRGTQPVQFHGFGIPREERRVRFDEALAIIERAWSGGRFSFEGKYFNVPDIEIVPRPLQKPHPPIRIAANSPDTAELAGLNGYDVMVASVINPMPQLFEHISDYRDAIARGSRPTSRGDVAALIFVYTADTRAQVRAEYEHSFMHYNEEMNNQAGLGEPNRPRNDSTLGHGRIPWETLETTMGILGSPDECIERINRIYEDSHLNQVMCWFNPGGRVLHRNVMAAMERFAARVIPAVRGLGE